jgi:hypothetical protein
MCEPHYRRLRRTGSTSAELPIGARRVPPPCTVPTCERLATEQGLCHAHYLRRNRVGSEQASQPLRPYGRSGCRVSGCAEPHYARDLCRIHYRRLMSTGDTRPDEPRRRPSPSGRVHHGYRVVTVPCDDRWLVGGRTSELEHRYVMAKQLGRPLRSDESVHHLNGDRLDNRAENLELWSRWQPSGQRVRDKICWAIELLELYRPEALTAALPLILDSE